jgi:hypothetical protein
MVSLSSIAAINLRRQNGFGFKDIVPRGLEIGISFDNGEGVPDREERPRIV